MQTVSLAQAKDRLSHYVASANAGEEIIITRHGRPAARLVALEDDREERRRRGHEAVLALAVLGDQIRAEGRGMPLDEVVAMIHEDRD